MKTKLTFYKENNKWYADIPETPKEENEMVFGADTFLEKVSDGAIQIVVEFSDTDMEDAIYAFEMIEHDEYGATYRNESNKEETIWLCNVAHTVFVEHPMQIFITDIKLNRFYEGRCCQHNATGHHYVIVGQGLMKMEDGLWYDCVTYRGTNWRLVDKPMTLFTKKLSDFNKEFILM
jgi:hypothetical protein